MYRALLILLPLLAIAIAGKAPGQPKLIGPGFLAIANQREHTLVLFDLAERKTVATVELGVNGHEVVISPDGKFAYVPIYGNSGVGKPGTDGQFIDVIDLHTRALAGHIDLGKPVRPHCAKFGPDGLLYVSAELANAILVVDPAARRVIAEIPTSQSQSHMFVISPDGRRAYTANVESGTVSVLDLQKRALVTVIPVAKHVQRITISADGRHVYTHDQDQPRIAVIDTLTNTVASYIPLPDAVYSSAAIGDGVTLVAASPSGKIFVIDTEKSKIVATVEVPPSSGEIIVTPDGYRVFLSCPQDGTIQFLDHLETKKPTLGAPIVLSKGVDGMAWTNSL